MQCLLRSMAAVLVRPARPLVASLHTTAGTLQTPGENGQAKAAVDPGVTEYRPISKDRSTSVPVETSIAYLQSPAYHTTYGDEPVWVRYRRNHKGHIPPRRTRRTCVRGGQISTGSPCPICRDEYLVLDYRNSQLLSQFVSEFNGAVLETSRTGLCRVQHMKLLTEMHKARDLGTISYDVPFREYDYDEYRPKPGHRQQ